ATGLFLVRVVELAHLPNRFAISDLRLAGDDFAVVLALDALHVDVEVELTHTADDRFARLLVLVHAEGRIFLGEAVERFGEIRLAPASLWRNGEGDPRHRYEHRR